MIKIYKVNTYGERNGQECVVIIKRGYKHFAKWVYWDTMVPELSYSLKFSGAALGALRKYFYQEKEAEK